MTNNTEDLNITVEKDIPMPPKSMSGRASKYPWDDMEVGDSFLVAESNSAPVPPSRLTEQGKKFSSRAVKKGFRVWRTE